MEAIQWEMTIPKEKQREFVKYYDQVLRPTWQKFGVTKCELFKIAREKSFGEGYILSEQFIETLYLRDGLSSDKFFRKVKNDPKAWEISRQYEKRFGAKNIVMKILRELPI